MGKELVWVRDASKAHYLNTGETYTLTLIATLQNLHGGSITLNALEHFHTLSRGSVRAHLKRLGSLGLVRRDSESVIIPVIAAWQ
jgi:Mn-dependent DtxR family transcriptional regulator